VKEIKCMGKVEKIREKTVMWLNYLLTLGFFDRMYYFRAFSMISVYANGRQISFSIQFLLQSGCFCVSNSGCEAEA